MNCLCAQMGLEDSRTRFGRLFAIELVGRWVGVARVVGTYAADADALLVTLWRVGTHSASTHHVQC